MSKFSLRNISIMQIISVILIIFALIFIYQNFEKVPVSLVIWKFDIPLFILLVITFMIGFFTAVAFGSNKIPADYVVNMKK